MRWERGWNETGERKTEMKREKKKRFKWNEREGWNETRKNVGVKWDEENERQKRREIEMKLEIGREVEMKR